MRRPQIAPRSLSMTYVAAAIAFCICVSGGLFHAYYKNRQRIVSRATAEIERNVEQCRLDIRISDMRMDQLLNRFAIRKQIEANGTTLRPIPMNRIEEIDAATLSRHSLATAAR